MLFKKWKNYDDEVAYELLFMFLDRCKFKNTLAFMQCRNAASSNEHKLQLRGIFQTRKLYLKKMLDTSFKKRKEFEESLYFDMPSDDEDSEKAKSKR